MIILFIVFYDFYQVYSILIYKVEKYVWFWIFGSQLQLVKVAVHTSDRSILVVGWILVLLVLGKSTVTEKQL